MNIVIEYSDEFGEEWPLTAKEISILDTNQGSLVDLLVPTNLLRLLCDSKVINKRQIDTISSKPTLHEKNETLLKILRRRSLRDYRQTIACLHQSEQSSIAEILDNGGGRTHIIFERALQRGAFGPYDRGRGRLGAQLVLKLH